jgi:hypothetical protein
MNQGGVAAGGPPVVRLLRRLFVSLFSSRSVSLSLFLPPSLPSSLPPSPPPTLSLGPPVVCLLRRLRPARQRPVRLPAEVCVYVGCGGYVVCGVCEIGKDLADSSFIVLMKEEVQGKEASGMGGRGGGWETRGRAA